MFLKKFIQKFPASFQCRYLNLQEHINHAILNEHGITTPKFQIAKCGKAAEKVAKDLLTKNLIVKAQVLAGGRGLGKFENGFYGGVHSAVSPMEVKEIASKMIDQKLITKQTGPEGKLCKSVMVVERKFPRREFYFAFAMDREHGPVIIASSRGGVNVEEIAQHSPESLIFEPIDAEKGFTKDMSLWILRRVGIVDQPSPACMMLCNLYDLFVKKDALLAEVNPYVEDVCLNYYPLDVKLTFDDNAEFRQKEIFDKRDESQEEEKELAASKLDMSYVSLDGTIGCLVNGAGLAMATVDILKFYNGNPANFLDIGSMASADAVREAIKIIMMDAKVRTIFVNIFGGIMKCDAVAEGLMKAIRELDLKIPIVLRIQGNNHEKAKKMIRDANTNIITCDTFDEGAEMAIRCSQIMKLADEGKLLAKLAMNLKCECDPNVPKNDSTALYPPLDNDDMSSNVIG